MPAVGLSSVLLYLERGQQGQAEGGSAGCKAQVLQTAFGLPGACQLVFVLRWIVDGQLRMAYT